MYLCVTGKRFPWARSVLVLMMISSAIFLWTNSSPATHESMRSLSDESSTAVPIDIQLFAVWTGNSSAQYFSSFFSSIQQNKRAKLLFVNRDSGNGCIDNLDQFSSNSIRIICLTDAQIYKLHTDFLCKGWKCSDAQRDSVNEQLRIRKDRSNIEWKPFWGLVFKDYVGPHRYAAWTDIDEMFGDLDELPAYTLDGTFDIFTMDVGGIEKNHIYLRGQFTAIKRSTKMDEIWLQFPELATPEDFIAKYPRGPLDERYHSLSYMSHESIDWIQLSYSMGGDVFIKAANEKTVQAGLAIIQIPMASTTEETLAALRDINTPGYPRKFEPQNNDVVAVSARCPDHWLALAKFHDTTARCIDVSPNSTVLYTAKYDGVVSQARIGTAGDRLPVRRFVNHFLHIKRRTWFSTPQTLDPGNVFEYSFSHIATWSARTRDYLKCFSERSSRQLCPMGSSGS